MDASLSREEVRDRLHLRVQNRLVPLLWALAAGFAFFALVTLVFRPPGATLALALIDGGGALVLAASALLVQRRGSDPRRANAIAAGGLLLTLAASLAAIKLLHLPAQTTNVLLVELVGSVVLLSRAWTAVLVVASLGGWSAVAASEGWGEAWLNAGFALVATSIMAVAIQVIRVRDARLTAQLAAANEDKASRLERAVEVEREHSRALATMNDSLEAFTYVVAHDLKEPIRSTMIYLEEARASPAERDDLLDRAIRSHKELDRLVKGLLEWSRATTMPLEPEPIDVRALLDEPVARQVFERPLQERRARLLIDSSIPPVLGTPALLRQALGNLILNAVRHSDKPEPEVRVYAAHDAPRGRVDLVVQDNGPGFPPDVLRRVQELVARPNTVKGGFGLAIARRAVERLGGELHAKNRDDGRGAEIHLVLPAPDARGEALARRVRDLV